MGTRLPRFSCLVVFFRFLAVVSFGQQVSPRPLVSQPVVESELTTLKGNTHPLAQPQFDIGAAPPELPMNRMLLVLKRSPAQEYSLRTLLDNQQDKASAHYHKWLTPDEFGAQFGLADQDVQIVTGWLQSHGFEVNRVSHGRTVIEFSGTEGQVEEALHTSIHKYAVNGEDHWANASDPQIPSALAPVVAGVWTLHDFLKKPNIRISPEVLKTKYTPGKQPDTTLTGSNGQVIHALSPADYATIYHITPLYNAGISGTGTIAVVGRSDISSDWGEFRNVFGLSGGSLQVINDGPDPGDLGGGEEAEATLDTTWSGAVAPNANIDFVVSASTNTTDGVDLSELYIIDNNVARVMTESFGSCELGATQSEAQGISMLAEQAAAQGITYMVSSGDSGAAGCDDPNAAPAHFGDSVSVLSSPQFTVAVGGTMFNEGSNSSKYWSSTNGAGLGSALSYIPENVWNESCLSCRFPNLFSSGGGRSTFFAKPTWQSGVSGIPNDRFRDVPDVSLTASIHDAYLLCLQGSCVPDSQGFISIFLIGGTSASAPSFAGIMNLVDQQQSVGQGQANYVLYRLAAAETLSQCNASNSTVLPASTCVFNDVTVGNNSVPGQTGFSAGTGYDLATGLGSVNATNLVNKWSTISFRATTATLTPSSITGTHGSPVTLDVSVAPNSGSGTPTGDVSLLTSVNQAVGFLSLSGGSQSSSVSSLPGGSYTLAAQYGGDATFAPSPLSTPVNVTISPESSVITASIFTLDQTGHIVPFTSGSYGGFAYPRANVAGASGQGTPTGFVYFYDNGNQYSGPMNLNSEGNTEYPNGTFFFTAGQHALTAFYGGDGSFKSGTSSPVNFTISQATTALTVTASPSAVGQGNNVLLTAKLSTPAFGGQTAVWNFPTGTVTFFNGSTQLGSSQLNDGQLTGNGETVLAGLDITTLPTGQNNITAQYSGDSNFIASSASGTTVTVDADFTVAAASSSVTIGSPGGSITNSLTVTGQTGYNSTINFSANSCSGLPALSSCSFSPGTVTGSGSTTVTITTAAPTSAALRASGWTGIGFMFAGVFLLNTKRRRFSSLLAICLLAGLSFTSVGCGGGGNSGGTGSPGTTPGTYNVVVKAATSDGVISHTIAFTVIIK
jgi:hypothetical protein